jgi:hypothetical protein
MIGGPGTSSRIAIAAALGFTLGGIAMGSNTTNAADLGGDCCADLEERVAELEATTVRKGNKKVSVTLSGWVIKAVNWWDDGDLDHFIVGRLLGTAAVAAFNTVSATTPGASPSCCIASRMTAFAPARAKS